jgi:hypothetical protein
MILVDFSQLMVGGLMSHAKTQSDVSEDLLRHMVLNTLRSYRKQYNKTYGELILCIDSRHYWRRDVFPNYKHARKKARDDSKFDWPQIFKWFDKIKAELKEHFPYKMIDVMAAEADDVIGVLSKFKHMEEKILILSSDKDFIQLHKYKNVKQYSPMQRKWVRHIDPIGYAKEHIIRGDHGDGIPNFLSGDNFLVEGIRQHPIAKKKVEVWLTQTPEEICEGNEEMMERWQRNELLTQFDKVPELLQKDILNAFKKEPLGARKKLYNYFVMNKLQNLMDVIGDF